MNSLSERLRLPRHDKNLTGKRVEIREVRLRLLLDERIEAADFIEEQDAILARHEHPGACIFSCACIGIADTRIKKLEAERDGWKVEAVHWSEIAKTLRLELDQLKASR